MITDIKQIFNSDEVCPIYSLCMYLPTADKFHRKAAEFISDEKMHMYGFYDDNLLVGVIAVRMDAEHLATIRGIAVKHTHRNKGVGRQLIAYSVKENSITELFAETDEDAVLFYQSCGFQTEEFYKDFGNGSFRRFKCTLLTT